MQNHHSPRDPQAFLLGAAVTAQSSTNLHSSGLACVRAGLDKLHWQHYWPTIFPSTAALRANTAGLVFRKITSFSERENNPPKANVSWAELRRLCSHLVIQSWVTPGWLCSHLPFYSIPFQAGNSHCWQWELCTKSRNTKYCLDLAEEQTSCSSNPSIVRRQAFSHDWFRN